MKAIFQYLAIVLGLCCVSCTVSKDSGEDKNTLPASALLPYGRYVRNPSQQLELVSPAVHFGFSFEGRECRLCASLPGAEGPNYLQDELEGFARKK
jgi:hypothetical protein